MCMYVCMCIYMYVCMCTCICACICMSIRMYIYILALRKIPGGVLVGGRVKSGETLGNGCSSTKSLLSSWKHGTYRGTWTNKSIQILDSFHIDLLNLWSKEG